MKMLRRLKKTALLSTLCATSVGAVVGGISSPALATTCNFGGPPSQLYCANSTWTSGDGWTNVSRGRNDSPQRRVLRQT